MAKSITDSLLQQQKMTKNSLEILKAIQNSFYTKDEHLAADINGSQYVIPAFLALESRINALQDDFDNLVNAPKTGDAAFNFNGSTQTIEIKGYNNIPQKAISKVDTDQYAVFDHESNAIFKDFCTPRPFIKLELGELPSDIQRVNVKKVIINSPELQTIIQEYLRERDKDGVIVADHISVGFEYSDLVKILYAYSKDEDYTEYDTIYDMPVRYGLGFGEYHIESIVKDWTDADFDEHYTFVLDNIIFKTKDETIQKQLQVGDYLILSNDKCKMIIEDIQVSTKTVTVRVIDGAYTNLTPYIQSKETGTLRYFNDVKYQEFKYLNIPLEEDQYVFIFAAPIQRGSLVQAPWGMGVLFNIYNLSCNVNGKTYYYKDYYEKFVNNVGDALFGLTDMFGESLVNFTQESFDVLTQLVPTIKPESLKVLEINKHLNNSDTIREIYGLYKQKTDYKQQLESVQREIDSVTSMLSNLSFQDTTQNRTIYEQQLNSLKIQKEELNSNIREIIQEIATTATDTDTPIDNPKYRIRGFFDYAKYESGKIKVIGIDVQYRYKNANASTGGAVTINNGIFSDWVQMDSPLKIRKATFEGVSTGFSYEYETDNTNINEISFNQIDIPIVQGETVDIRIRLIYNIGQPFVQVNSDWSEIINIEFPTELRQNVTVLDIIEENNSEIKKDQFNSILDKTGTTKHIADSIVDQDTTYLHQPESIASGFYTAERRIIPLKDKLTAMDAILQELQDEIQGTETETLSVIIADDNSSTTIYPYSSNEHVLPAYNDSSKENSIAVQVLNLEIKNNSNHIVKLFSIFPGSKDDVIQPTSLSKFTVSDYVMLDVSGKVLAVYMESGSQKALDNQHQNQWMYFRIKNAFDGNILYSVGDMRSVNSKISSDLGSDGKGAYIRDLSGAGQMVLYPSLQKIDDICINGGSSYNYQRLLPGESVYVPIVCKYWFDTSKPGPLSKTLSFDIRTSLYKDPINYQIDVTAKMSDTLADKTRRKLSKSKYQPVVVKTQVIQTSKK